jgi:hypothetical protein
MTERFVYLVYEAGNFRLALEGSLELRAHGAGDPILFSPYYLPDTESYRAQAARHGIPYVHESTRLGGDADPFGQLAAHGIGTPATALPEATPRRAPFPARMRNRLAARWLRKMRPQIDAWDAHYHGRLGVAARVLHAAGAAALVLPEDNVERDSASWCRAIHARGGRATVISYGAMNPDEAAIAYYDNPEHAVASDEDRRFALLFPKWKTRYKGRSLLRLPAARAFAMERLGLAPRNPWIVNTGDVDAIAVESEFMRERFAEHGIPRARIHAIGHSGLDALAQATRSRDEVRTRWQQELQFDPAQPVVLCAMPPDQYPALAAPGFASYAEMVDGWLAALDTLRPQYFPVVSPHPNIAPAIRERIRAAGFPVLEGGVAQWLPSCDLFVASVSGTIKWALACGKPIVNYDCYDYRHADYTGIDEVAHAATFEEFRSALGRFANPSYLSERARESQRRSGRFGLLDGKAGDRIAALVRGGAMQDRGQQRDG